MKRPPTLLPVPWWTRQNQCSEYIYMQQSTIGLLNTIIDFPNSPSFLLWNLVFFLSSYLMILTFLILPLLTFILSNRFFFLLNLILLSFSSFLCSQLYLSFLLSSTYLLILPLPASLPIIRTQPPTSISLATSQ